MCSALSYFHSKGIPRQILLSTQVGISCMHSHWRKKSKSDRGLRNEQGAREKTSARLESRRCVSGGSHPSFHAAWSILLLGGGAAVVRPTVVTSPGGAERETQSPQGAPSFVLPFPNSSLTTVRTFYVLDDDGLWRTLTYCLEDPFDWLRHFKSLAVIPLTHARVFLSGLWHILYTKTKICRV